MLELVEYAKNNLGRGLEVELYCWVLFGAIVI